jgi:hypothetical protein
MITLREAIRKLQDTYALRRPDDPKSIIRSFEYIFEERFKGKKFQRYIVDVKLKRKNRIVLHVTHPAVIQEIESFKEELLKQVNDDLGEKMILDIEFRVVPSGK